MAPYQYLDDLVREYLLFRGFSASLKSFDADIKAEKEKGFRADRLVDQVVSCIQSHDLQGLRELWQHLNTRLFRRLDPVQTGSVGRLECGVLKLYVVNCIQTKSSEKVKDFFDKMAPELHGQPDWKEWFALPFLPSPESHPVFAGYFTRQWQDTLLLSLHNFLAVVFASLPPPRLADYQSTSAKLRQLREENEAMKQALLKQHRNLQQRAPDIPPPEDLMDDFYIIASSSSSSSLSNLQDTSAEGQAKGLKNFLRNITGAASSSSNSPPPQTIVTRDKRSSSKTRLTAKETKDKSHAPVKRVSQKSSAVNLSSLSLSESGSNNSTGGERMAYLLLGQEEYGEHHSEVTQCKFSSSGYLMASGDVDGVVKIWSASPGAPQTLATFISQSAITSLDWVANSERHFVYGTNTGTVRLCDKDERKATAELGTEESANVQQVACSPNGSLCAVATTKLALIDLKSCTPVELDMTSNTMSLSCVTTCVFNHNSQMIITGNSDGKVRIYDLRKRDCIASWSVQDSATLPVLTLQMSHDETSIYALAANGNFSSWSFIQTSQKLFDYQLEDPYFADDAHNYPRSGWGKQFAFAGDGKHVLACSSNGGVIYEVIEEQSLNKVLGLKGHRRHATCTDWSASQDCGPCVTAGFDGQIRVSTLLSQ